MDLENIIKSNVESALRGAFQNATITISFGAPPKATAAGPKVAKAPRKAPPAADGPTVGTRILDYLANLPPVTAVSVPDIAAGITAKSSTVQVAVSKLLKQGKIAKAERGLYKGLTAAAN